MGLSFDSFGYRFSWLLDGSRLHPSGPGEAGLDFNGEFSGTFMISGGTGLVSITDIFSGSSLPDIFIYPTVYLNGQLDTDGRLEVEFGVPFAVRAVFSYSELRQFPYRNFNNSGFGVSRGTTQALQNGVTLRRVTPSLRCPRSPSPRRHSCSDRSPPGSV